MGGPASRWPSPSSAVTGSGGAGGPECREDAPDPPLRLLRAWRVPGRGANARSSADGEAGGSAHSRHRCFRKPCSPAHACSYSETRATLRPEGR